MAVVVITGASSGLGRALALESCRQGHSVMASARRPQELEQLVEEAKALSGRMAYTVADVTIRDHIFGLRDETISSYGGLDVWINNAGSWYRAPVEDLDEKEVDKVLDTDFRGVIFGSQAAYKHMKARRSGLIINVLSTTATNEIEGESVYGGAKAGALHFSAILGKEAAPHGVKVCRFCPGGMMTPFNAGYAASRENDPAYMDPVAIAKLIVPWYDLPANIVPAHFVVKRIPVPQT